MTRLLVTAWIKDRDRVKHSVERATICSQAAVRAERLRNEEYK